MTLILKAADDPGPHLLLHLALGPAWKMGELLLLVVSTTLATTHLNFIR